jgi:magnesium-transporting ATPase (P-type)
MNLLVKILVIIGSVASIGFGIWHFFVPKVWNWYSYIDPKAAELVIAVRAINVFFSLALVLFGVINFLFVFGDHANRYSKIVLLSATTILWLTRFSFQLFYPQGSLYPGLQYGMLAAFGMITLCHLAPLLITWLQKVAG